MNALNFLKELDGLTGQVWNAHTHEGFVPRVDVKLEKDHYELLAEVPGFGPSEVDLVVHDGVLELKGSLAKDTEAESDSARWLIRERGGDAFSRSFRLPQDVDAEKITAEFRHGLLVLNLPKKEELKPRQVPIKVA